MSFKPVRLTMVFWALLGASLAVSSVASADSSTSAPAVSSSVHESEIISIDGVEKISQKSSVEGKSGTTGFSENGGSKLQSVTTADAGSDGVSFGSDGTQGLNKTSGALTQSDADRQLAQLTESDKVSSVTGNASGKTLTTDSNGIKKTESAALSVDSSASKVTEVSMSDIGAKISQSAAASVVVKNRAVVPAAVVQDSGGLTQPVAETPASPAHPYPAAPIGVMGEFNALMHAVVPVSHNGVSVVGRSVVIAAKAIGLDSLILILVIGAAVCVGMFVDSLRRSGFSNGARSDIPNFSFLVVDSEMMGLIRATVNGSFFSGLKAWRELSV